VDAEVLQIAGRDVKISNPGKVFFPRAGVTKLDLVRYYLAVGEGALRGIHGRPIVLKRYPHGAEGEFFFQKRAPTARPDWVTTVRLAFPSGRTADEVVVTDLAQLAWLVNLGCLDLNPHPVRADDLEHPDELRIDLDPGPGVEFDRVREAAGVVREVLAEARLTGWPKTSGSRGIHVYVRIARRWSFDAVRRAALALARDAERHSSPAAGGKRSVTASSSTTTRTPRTARSRRPTRCVPRPTLASPRL
jgi:bifunctional non-homologous end joining protein LigD